MPACRYESPLEHQARSSSFVVVRWRFTIGNGRNLGGFTDLTPDGLSRPDDGEAYPRLTLTAHLSDSNSVFSRSNFASGSIPRIIPSMGSRQ